MLFYGRSSLGSSDLCSIFAGFSLPGLSPSLLWTPGSYPNYQQWHLEVSVRGSRLLVLFVVLDPQDWESGNALLFLRGTLEGAREGGSERGRAGASAGCPEPSAGSLFSSRSPGPPSLRSHFTLAAAIPVSVFYL